MGDPNSSHFFICDISLIYEKERRVAIAPNQETKTRNLEPGKEAPDIVVASGQGSIAFFPFPVDDDANSGLNASLIIRFSQLLVEKTGCYFSGCLKITIRAVINLQGFQNSAHNGNPLGTELRAAPFKSSKAIEAKRHRIRSFLV